jgi:hypothetical protein
LIITEIKSSGKGAVIDVIKIDAGKIVKKDWCKENPYTLNPVTYTTTTWNFFQGKAKDFTLDPLFSSTETCDAVDPVFTYSITYPVVNDIDYSGIYNYIPS